MGDYEDGWQAEGMCEMRNPWKMWDN